MNKISIIIPMLNEAESISDLLTHLMHNSNKENISEIIVVDGGSDDGCRACVASFKNVILLNSEKGRAKQMNLGAKKASETVLYFLHADSFPPKNFDEYILAEIEKGNDAGCFRMRFDHDHWWLKLAGWLTQFHWRACRGGDQSQFITRALFDELGGYDDRYTIYEDNDLINKLYEKKEFVVIQKELTTSARCYKKNGVWRLQYFYWSIYVKKWLGASPEKLYRYYKKNIA